MVKRAGKWQRYLTCFLIALLVAAAALLSAHLYSLRKPKIAVIWIEGTIGQDLKYEAQASAALRDPNIKAVVVVVNSPGGGVDACFGTERMFRKLKGEKPIVVTMEGYAASGAYLVSSAANYIFARHGTITGGFGVIAIWVCYENKWKGEGIDIYVWKSGQTKDLFAEWRAPTEEESVLIQEMVDNYMRDLIDRLKQNRPLASDEIEELRDGSVITGVEALERQLVDELGEFFDALRKAEELAGLKEGEYTLVRPYLDERGFWQFKSF